jgi:hypothetical protein
VSTVGVNAPPFIFAGGVLAGAPGRIRTANKMAAAERAVTDQPLALSRIRPARVLVRNLLSSCSHGAESMEAAAGAADA